MKPHIQDFSIALRTINCRGPIHLIEVLAPFGCRALALINNRAEICSPVFLAALLFIGTPAANAANLGRLFFTPEQRAQLDYAYARNAPAQGSASPILTVNGIVQKNGGARTVWVNGIAQSAGNRGERNPTTQSVTVPGKSHPVKIKVGDRILLDQSAPPGQHSPMEQP